MTRLVVKSHNPRRVLLLRGGLVLATLLLAGGLFEYGRYRAGFDFASARAEMSQLHQARYEAEQREVGLREQIALLERSQQVENEACKQLEGTVAGLQTEIADLKGELAFYRGIVGSAETNAGLRVQSFDVTPNGPQRGYRYKLVLTQVLKNDTVAAGQASLNLEGIKGGKKVVVSFSEIGAKDAGKLDFKFRYFQNFEGDIVLPDGFVPGRVIVKVNPRDQRYRSMEKVFDWPVQES